MHVTYHLNSIYVKTVEIVRYYGSGYCYRWTVKIAMVKNIDMMNARLQVIT